MEREKQEGTGAGERRSASSGGKVGPADWCEWDLGRGEEKTEEGWGGETRREAECRPPAAPRLRDHCMSGWLRLGPVSCPDAQNRGGPQPGP